MVRVRGGRGRAVVETFPVGTGTGGLVVEEDVIWRGRRPAGGLGLVVGGINVRLAVGDGRTGGSAVTGGSEGTDTTVDASTVRVQLTNERVLVVFVHALTVKVRWTVTTLGEDGRGGAEADMFPAVTVLVTVTKLVVVDGGSSCSSSSAACSLIFWTSAVGSAAHTPIVTRSLVRPETTVGSQLLHPKGCSALGFSLVGVSATVSATGRGLATTYEANARKASLTKTMLILIRLCLLWYRFCCVSDPFTTGNFNSEPDRSVHIHQVSSCLNLTPFSAHTGNIEP